MKEQIEALLYQVAEEVMEKLAFIFSFEENDRDNMDYQSAVGACVSFTGPFTGNIVMAISKDTLPELAGNMLGLDDEDKTSVEQQYDALKELINVICGNLLPAISGKQSVFNVNAPIIIQDIDAYCQEISLKDENPPQVPAVAKMALDDGQCDLMLFVDGQIPTDSE